MEERRFGVRLPILIGLLTAYAGDGRPGRSGLAAACGETQHEQQLAIAAAGGGGPAAHQELGPSISAARWPTAAPHPLATTGHRRPARPSPWPARGASGATLP